MEIFQLFFKAKSIVIIIHLIKQNSLNCSKLVSYFLWLYKLTKHNKNANLFSITENETNQLVKQLAWIWSLWIVIIVWNFKSICLHPNKHHKKLFFLSSTATARDFSIASINRIYLCERYERIGSLKCALKLLYNKKKKKNRIFVLLF
jgi:hypothetical protein